MRAPTKLQARAIFSRPPLVMSGAMSEPESSSFVAELNSDAETVGWIALLDGATSHVRNGAVKGDAASRSKPNEQRRLNITVNQQHS